MFKGSEIITIKGRVLKSLENLFSRRQGIFTNPKIGMCVCCGKYKHFKTKSIPKYRKLGEKGVFFICLDCIRKEYENGNYYKRI